MLQLVTIILSLLRMSVEPALHFWSPGTRLFEQFPGHMKELIVGELKVESFGEDREKRLAKTGGRMYLISVMTELTVSHKTERTL